MDMSDAFRESFEVVALSERTIDQLVQRTDKTREELEEKLKDARSQNDLIVFTLFKLEKLS